MKKIVCLGTSHTYGGAEEYDYTFYEGWPGQLSKYLEEQGIENYTYNGGESSFSSYFYPTKIINFYNEYKPDMFVIEVPDIDKVDIEISSAITGTYINKQKDYHPIYSRQRVLTKDWKKGKGYAWPNRKSISKGEAVDFYHGSDTTKNIKDFFKGHHTVTMEAFYGSVGLGDHERENVKSKFNELYTALGRDDDSFKNMLIYCYFHSLFIDASDSEMAGYMANTMNIINTLKMLGVKFVLWSHVRKQYLDHFIFEETYKDIIGKPEYWLNGDLTWNFRKFCNKWAREESNPKEFFETMKSDKIHFHPWVYTRFINEMMGPQVLDKLKG